MSYSGKYECPVAGCGFSITNVVGNHYVDQGQPSERIEGNSSQCRSTMLAHGESVHQLDWKDTSNSVFVPPSVELEFAIGEPEVTPA